MGLADRDYMRTPPDQPGPPVGGVVGVVFFVLLLAGLIFVGMEGHTRFYAKHIAKPISHFMKNLGSSKTYHKRKHRR